MKTRILTLTSLLIAICVISRWICPWLPNVKPVTAIIILSTLFLGIFSGVAIAVVQTLLSNILLGMGIWTIFQIGAWLCIVFLTHKLRGILRNKPYTILPLYGFFSGLIYGILQAPQYLLYVPLNSLFLTYASGIPYDILHGIGNAAFLTLLYYPLKRLCQHYVNKSY